jgi:tetratricopeptide (TPR) repeat protein
MILLAIVAGLLLSWGQQIPDAPVDWRALFDTGRQAYAQRQYADARRDLAAAAGALASDPAEPALVEILRYLSAACRESGDAAEAEQTLQHAAQTLRAADPAGLSLAALLEELAVVQRARSRPEEALASIQGAIEIRAAHPDSPRAPLARDLTTAAILLSKTGEPAQTIEAFHRAIREWDQASPGDPQSITAVEALATLHRDRAEYEDAEPLLLRALRLREAASGPDSAEVITAVDSLAYVEFGLKKFSEAEPLYLRLAALWEKNAGPDHPMLALTFDKMAEFYAFQQRYGEAERFAKQALALRAKMHLASLNQTGRVLLMEAKLEEGDSLYQRAIRIGDLAEAPDDVMDPVLRTSATLLRTLHRDEEAEKLEARVKAALIRKGDREGRLPPPVTLPKP